MVLSTTDWWVNGQVKMTSTNRSQGRWHRRSHGRHTVGPVSFIVHRRHTIGHQLSQLVNAAIGRRRSLPWRPPCRRPRDDRHVTCVADVVDCCAKLGVVEQLKLMIPLTTKHHQSVLLYCCNVLLLSIL